MSQHSVGRTRMINLPAELGWISKNLPLGPRPSGLGHRGRFLLTHPRSAGRFIPNSQTMGGYGKLADQGRIRQTRRQRADTAASARAIGGYFICSGILSDTLGHWNKASPSYHVILHSLCSMCPMCLRTPKLSIFIPSWDTHEQS